jgi:WhiB family transcriptional regulator, redox-sensing transcriptional regulator
MLMEWRRDAACKNQDAELFFPIGTGDASARQVNDAKAVCHRCPVIAACLAWATANDPVAGIWGGTTEQERASARRRRLGLATVAPAGA